MKVEDLGPMLYTRASWKDPWLNLTPRDSYPVGAGLTRSAFTIGRSEPATDEETWNPIVTTSGSTFTGSCGVTYNQTYVGYLETQYKPEGFGLVGPLVCQDDLTLHWNSRDFWEKYFQALEKRNVKSIINRLANIYMNYVPKAAAGTSFSYIAGNFATQPPGSSVSLSGLSTPSCGLIQDYLDTTALILMEEGADEPNTNGWITQGPEGPIFPVIQRLGASRVIKNFRHIITRFPPRWKLVGGNLTRVPTWIMSTASGDATKGQVAIVNPEWQNPNIAAWEAALVLNPWVFTEEVLQPVNSAPGMKWNPHDYFGEWQFVTGNDALLGFDGCTGVSDPTHKLGRHFAEYRHAAKPIFPQYGRMILFQRCPAQYDCIACS
jgi:hypothetical protein